MGKNEPRGESPSHDWTHRMEEGHRLPYVALVRVRVRTDGFEDSIWWGTGLLVDDRHVLTCFHVVHPVPEDLAGAPRRSRNEPLPRYEAWDALRRIEVDLGEGIGTFANAVIVAEDDRSDLALLCLDAAVVGPSAPIGARVLPAGPCRVWVCGFQGEPGWLFTRTGRELDPTHVTSGTGGARSGVHALGLEPGYSGGPIFAEKDGRPAFVGMVDIGGLGVSVGGFVAADMVRSFLAGSGIAIPDGESDGGLDHWCRIEGYAPRLKSPRPTLLPDHHVVRYPGRPNVRYHGLHPIAAAAVDARPMARRLAAHLVDARAVERVLARLRAETRLPLRLPTEQEFANLCAAAPEPPSVLGRPTTIDDYLGGDGTLQAPPDTSAEWIEDRGRCFLLLRRDDELIRFDDADALAREFPHLRAVLRTVLTPGRSPS